MGEIKKLPLGGGFGVNGRHPLSQLGGSTYAGEPGVTDCHGYLKTNRAMTSFLRGVRPDGASGIEGNGKKDGLPKQPIF